jgi:GTPase
VRNCAQGQILFVDTPGLHSGGARALNRQLNRAARQAIGEADVVVQVAEAGRWSGEDEAVYAAAVESGRPRLLVLNKVDAQKDKRRLLPFIAEVSATRTFAGVYLVSARRRDGLAELENAIFAVLPETAPVFGTDQITDRNERFLAAELVREQLMLQLAQELPYSTAVEIDEFRDSNGRSHIEATIWVEREGQKPIVIGAGGARLKAIGVAARRSMERLFERRIDLRLHVKVTENWSDDAAALRRFGYAE